MELTWPAVSTSFRKYSWPPTLVVFVNAIKIIFELKYLKKKLNNLHLTKKCVILLTVFNGWFIRVHKSCFHILDCQRWFSCLKILIITYVTDTKLKEKNNSLICILHDSNLRRAKKLTSLTSQKEWMKLMLTNTNNK